MDEQLHHAPPPGGNEQDYPDPATFAREDRAAREVLPSSRIDTEQLTERIEELEVAIAEYRRQGFEPTENVKELHRLQDLRQLLGGNTESLPAA